MIESLSDDDLIRRVLKFQARPPQKPGILAFLACNILVALAISAGYLPHLDAPRSDWPVIAAQAVGHFSMLALLAALVLAGLRAILPPGAFRWASGALLTVAQLVLFIDVVIYHLFRFHINGMVLTDITTPGAADSIHIGAKTFLTFGLVAVAVALAQVAALGPITRFVAASPALSSRRIRVLGVALALAAVALDKGLYAYGDLYYRPSLFKYTRILPAYVPLTMKHFAADHLGVSLERPENVPGSPASGLLRYPPLGDLPRAKKGPNIILFILDSWRYDMLNADATPELWKLRRSSAWYRRHFTGGTSTRYGIFSLLYGLPPTYWDVFLGENRGTVLVDALKKAGYDFCVVSSTRLTFPEFWKTAFISIPEAIHDGLPGTEPWQKDAAQPETLFNFLDSRKDKSRPFFAFMFLDSPHSPYSYPDKEEKFRPSAHNVNYLDIKKGGGVEIFNRYRNGILHGDKVAGILLAGLKRRKLLDKSWLFVTGDHGEEFWESGNWGHTSAFSLEQCSVPMLVRSPKGKGSEVDFPTSHFDFAPTVFELIGAPRLGGEYTVGRSLLKAGPRTQWGVTGYRETALFTDNRVVVFGTHFRNAGDIEVRDWKYKVVADSDAELRKLRPLFRSILEEQRRFLK